MNRFHVHLNVVDLDASIRFYSNLFAAQPSVVKGDYAKWMPGNLRTSPRTSRRELFGRPARRASLRHGGLHAQDAQRRWTAKQTRPEGLLPCAPATALNALTVE